MGVQRVYLTAALFVLHNHACCSTVQSFVYQKYVGNSPPKLIGLKEHMVTTKRNMWLDCYTQSSHQNNLFFRYIIQRELHVCYQWDFTGEMSTTEDLSNVYGEVFLS